MEPGGIPFCLSGVLNYNQSTNMKNLISYIRANHNINFAWLLFFILLGGLYGTVAAGQILGFLKLFYPIPVFILSVILSVAAIGLLLKYAKPFLESVLEWRSRPLTWLDYACYFAGILLLVALILIPIIRWPYSAVSTNLYWDAGLYHFPKAIEMVKSGSAWDLTIAYGDYPFGYESLIALVFAFTHSTLLFGTVHALITAFFILSLWLLACRITRLAPALLFLIISIACCSLTLLHNLVGNPWDILNIQIDIIGNNDLFLGGAMLALLLFIPIGSRDNHLRYSICGMALTSMLVASIKPNGAILLVFAWGIFLIYQNRDHDNIVECEMYIRRVIINIDCIVRE